MSLCTRYLHVRSVCFFFLTGRRKKKKQPRGSFRKKGLYICFTFFCVINILHLFKEAYFCFWADRAVFTLSQDIVQYVYVFLFICI